MAACGLPVAEIIADTRNGENQKGNIAVKEKGRYIHVQFLISASIKRQEMSNSWRGNGRDWRPCKGAMLSEVEKQSVHAPR